MEQLCEDFLKNPTLCNLGAYLGFDEDAAKVRARFLLQHVGIIPKKNSPVFCAVIVDEGNQRKCGLQMRGQGEKSTPMGFRFFCKGSQEAPHRPAKVNPASNTICERDRIGPHKVVQLLLHYFHNYPVIKAAEACGVCEETAVWWYRFVRRAMYLSAWHDYERIGGPDGVVEVDECHLYHSKYYVGRPLAHQSQDVWTFGGVCRLTGKRFAMLVPDRRRETLFAELRRCVLPGTHLITDGFAVYAGCDRDPPDGCGFSTHEVVIHKENFVWPPKFDPPLWKNVQEYGYEARDKQFIGPYPEGLIPYRISTQKCERGWRCLKDTIKHGNQLNTDHLEEYIASYMYRHNILNAYPDNSSKLRRLCFDIGRAYAGPNKNNITDKINQGCQCSNCA